MSRWGFPLLKDKGYVCVFKSLELWHMYLGTLLFTDKDVEFKN